MPTWLPTALGLSATAVSAVVFLIGLWLRQVSQRSEEKFQQIDDLGDLLAQLREENHTLERLIMSQSSRIEVVKTEQDRDKRELAEIKEAVKHLVTKEEFRDGLKGLGDLLRESMRNK